MKRFLYGVVFALALVASFHFHFIEIAKALATSGCVTYGSGFCDSTFQFSDSTHALTVQSSVAGNTTAQVIGAGGIIAADSCGGLKAVTAAGGVSTDATNPFTAPATANKGCTMIVCNRSSGANTITLKHATAFISQGGADVALAQNTCVGVASDGTTWSQTSGLQTNS